MINKDYGVCERCGTKLQVSEWFTEYEYDEKGMPTGRTKKAVSSLICPCCLKNYCVDDTFDEPWRDKQ